MASLSASSSMNSHDDNSKNNDSSFDDDDDDDDNYNSCSSSSCSEMNNPSIMHSAKLLSVSSGFPSVTNNIEVVEDEDNNQK